MNDSVISRCLARHLGACEAKLSGEHPVSKSLLRLIESTEGGVWVQGFPWLGQEAERRIGVSSLVANVFCTKHNSNLSVLDATALEVARVLKRFSDREPGAALTTVNGRELERFLLKVLMGLVASKQTRYRAGDVIPPDVPPDWIDVAFGIRLLPARCGLYVAHGRIPKNEGRDYAISPLSVNRRVAGVKFRVFDVCFTLAAIDPGPNPTGGITNKYLYRPPSLRLNHSNPRHGRAVLNFTW